MGAPRALDRPRLTAVGGGDDVAVLADGPRALRIQHKNVVQMVGNSAGLWIPRLPAISCVAYHALVPNGPPGLPIRGKGHRVERKGYT